MRHYRIYPSLMDAYTRMTEAEDEEQQQERIADLLASINRVEREPNYYAARGTALNDWVDRYCDKEAKVKSILTLSTDSDGELLYQADIDGFALAYEGKLVNELGKYLMGWGMPLCQVFCKTSLDMEGDEVELYGYADYVIADIIIDLKSTQEYTPAKYRDHWQHRVYPYCMVKSGMMEYVTAFEYLVAEVKAGKSGVIGGRMFSEAYMFNYAQAEREMREMLGGGLLPFIERHRAEITDKRIFNE